MKKGDQMQGVLDAFTGINKDKHTDEPHPILRTEAPEIVGESDEPTETEDKSDIINSIENDELREALRKKRMDGRGRPRKNTEDGKRTDGYSRYTLVASIEKMAKLKEIAFRSTLTQKEVFETALDLLIEKYESVHGEVVPEPEKYKGNVNNLFK